MFKNIRLFYDELMEIFLQLACQISIAVTNDWNTLLLKCKAQEQFFFCYSILVTCSVFGYFLYIILHFKNLTGLKQTFLINTSAD